MCCICKVFIWHTCSRPSLSLCLSLSLSLSLCEIQVYATQLYQDSFMGNADEVKKLLEGGADVNEPNDVSKTDIDKMDEYL